MTKSRTCALALYGIAIVLVSGLQREYRHAQAAELAAKAATIDQLIASGEFAPALLLAQRLPEPAQQQVALRQIALAQAAAGDARASRDTAYQVESDIARVALLQELRRAPGAAGGAKADFEPLINLITSTTSPTTWKVNGGQGDVAGFEGGIYCDAKGTLLRRTELDPTRALEKLRQAALEPGLPGTVRTKSPLRKISLVRLEAAVQRHLAEGTPLPDEVRYLAGLERIQYVLVYPEQRDIVLAGPADDWRMDEEGRSITVGNGAPVMQLDDLVVVLRHMQSKDGAIFGCSITPTKERLAATQEFLTKSTQRPLKPGERERWLKDLREQLGQQRIDIYGLDPRSRAAQVLVEADYRMKLVGIGLEPAVQGVENYLASIKVPAGQAPPPLDVLRWWFALNYDAIRTNAAKDVFELRGQGVQVLSENELLAKDGERQHTGGATDLNKTFTTSFTKHYGELCKKYPVYAELRNLFDLALVGAILKSESLPDRCAWHQTCFGDAGEYRPRLDIAPQWVDSVMNHRVVNRVHVLVGVSGGVRADPWSLVQAEKHDTTHAAGLTNGRRYSLEQRPAERTAWWWD
jgi:hypothetical protein